LKYKPVNRPIMAAVVIKRMCVKRPTEAIKPHLNISCILMSSMTYIMGITETFYQLLAH